MTWPSFLPILRALHAVRLDRPRRLVQVDFRPFGLPQFAWPLKDKRGELQRGSGDRLTAIVVDGTKELPGALWIRDGGQMPHLDWTQGIAQVRGRVALAQP